MLPTISGALGFLLAPVDAYVGRLICLYVLPLQILAETILTNSQLPYRLIPSLLRHRPNPNHIQHRRDQQAASLHGYDLGRSMRR